MGNFCSGKEKAQLKSMCHLQPQELCCEPLKELGIQGQDIFEGWGRFAAGEEDGQAPGHSLSHLSSSSPPNMIWDLKGEQSSWAAFHQVLLVLATGCGVLTTGRSESQGLYANDPI